MTTTHNPDPHSTAMGAPEGMERCPIMPTYAAPSIQFVEGAGSWLTDREGKRYLDLLSGLAVTSLGHAHPAVAEAVAAQAQRLVHTSNLYATEHAAPVAQTLDRLLGGGGQVFFANSGAEANECAMKLARKWAGHGRYVVVSAYGSFHGRTMATLAATGQPAKHEPFAPMPEGYRHVAWADLAHLESAIDETAFVVGPVLVGLLAAWVAPWLPLVAAAGLSLTAVVAFALHPTGAVRSHATHLNNAFWQLKATYDELRTRPIAKTRLLSARWPADLPAKGARRFMTANGANVSVNEA